MKPAIASTALAALCLVLAAPVAEAVQVSTTNIGAVIRPTVVRPTTTTAVVQHNATAATAPKVTTPDPVKRPTPAASASR